MEGVVCMESVVCRWRVLGGGWRVAKSVNECGIQSVYCVRTQMIAVFGMFMMSEKT